MIVTFCETVLDHMAQPVVVIDHEQLICFVNPAASAALGYARPDDLLGEPGHATLQDRHADGSPFAIGDSMILKPLATGETARVERDWLMRRDGSMLPVWFSSAPIGLPDGRGVVCAFKDASAERDGAERAVRRRIIEASDEVRRRMARDLHDGAQQQLFTAVMNLQLAMRKLDGDLPESRTLLATALVQAEEGIGTLRDLVAGIHPAVLTHLGLRAAVGALAGRTPIPVHLDVPDERLDPSIEVSVYFFVSEALTNVIKHAQATEAFVRIAAEDGRLMVEVTDDGIGGADLRAAGSGLLGLADRIEALGGELSVTSPPELGTTLAATVPTASAG